MGQSTTRTDNDIMMRKLKRKRGGKVIQGYQQSNKIIRAMELTWELTHQSSFLSYATPTSLHHPSCLLCRFIVQRRTLLIECHLCVASSDRVHLPLLRRSLTLWLLTLEKRDPCNLEIWYYISTWLAPLLLFPVLSLLLVSTGWLVVLLLVPVCNVSGPVRTNRQGASDRTNERTFMC